MKKITEQQFKDGNRKIAEFMGYIHYHKGVDIDTSECGGIYDRCEVFSKVPILVDEFPESDQYYFSDLPNPDFGNNDNPRWNSDYKELSWATLNYHSYRTSLAYHNDWNQLQEVVEKIKEMEYPIMIYQSHVQNTAEIFGNAINDRHFIVRESSTVLKPIEIMWSAIVRFIDIHKKQNDKKD